jgi:hypothetical protein
VAQPQALQGWYVSDAVQQGCLQQKLHLVLLLTAHSH